MTEQTKRKAARWVTVVTIVALALAGLAAGQSNTLYIYDRNGNLLRMANTLIDPLNCGGLNIVCPSNNIRQPLCTSGTCEYRCVAGYDNCDHISTNGCEIALNTISNCGGCGIKCSTNHINATCGSPSGPCNGTCAQGWADCDGNKQSNGCEVNITSNLLNCDGCGQACSTNNIVASCVAVSNGRGWIGGYCTGTCRYGYDDCDNNKRSNGCEASLTSDSSCSGCGVQCSSGQHCRVGYGSSSFSCGY